MKLAPLASVAIIVGLVGYIIGGVAPSTPAQSGWSGVPTADQLMGRSPGPMGIAHPRDWIVLRGGDCPYQVPAGRVVVWTGLGLDYNATDIARIRVSDTGIVYKNVAEVTGDCNDGNASSIKALPVGLSCDPLTWVNLQTTGGNEALA